MHKPYFHHVLQYEDFSIDEQYRQLQSSCPEAGAIVTFTGLVRDMSKVNTTVQCIELHTYPAMATQQIKQIGLDVFARFNIDGISIIHRHGKLRPTEQIVYVGVASKHRAEAFLAAQMTMDFLKSKVAFWKKEHYLDHSEAKWIEPSMDDQNAINSWLE